MADTKPMEYTAEDLISYTLLRAKFFVSKPKFDRDGTDLIVMKNFKDAAKFVRVQCKGRNISRGSSHVDILKDYIRDSLIVFVFIEDSNLNSTNLYVFFPDEIKEFWKESQSKKNAKSTFRLNLKKKTYEKELEKFQYKPEKTTKINTLIEQSRSSEQFELLIGREAQTNEIRIDHSNSPKIVSEKWGPSSFKLSKINGSVDTRTTIAMTLGSPENYEFNPITETFSVKKGRKS